MNQAIKLVVSLLVGLAGLAVVIVAGFVFILAVGFVLSHFLTCVNVALTVMIVTAVWKLAYDELYGDS